MVYVSKCNANKANRECEISRFVAIRELHVEINVLDPVRYSIRLCIKVISRLPYTILGVSIESLQASIAAGA